MGSIAKVGTVLSVVIAAYWYKRWHRQPVNPVELNLATIDLSEINDNFEQLSQKAGEAFEKIGFAYMENVPGLDREGLLKAAKWFFDLPLDVKYRYAKSAFKKDNPNRFRGYFPIIPSDTSYKEAFETGIFFQNLPTDLQDYEKPLKMRTLLTEGCPWPETDDPQMDKYFRELFEQQFYAYANGAKMLLSLTANYLGMPRDYFDHMFGPDQLSTLRALHYPDRSNDPNLPPNATVEKGLIVTTSEHFDTSVLTLLMTFGEPGLQVDLNHDGNWQDVPPNDGLVINCGQLLSDFSAGRLKATYHRVVDLGRSRYSFPLFYEPHFDADVSKDIYGNNIRSIKPGTKYGPWMTNRVTNVTMFAEYKTTDWGIPD